MTRKKVVLPAPLCPTSPSRSPSVRLREMFFKASTITVLSCAARVPPSRENIAVFNERVFEVKIGKEMLTSWREISAIRSNPIDDATFAIADQGKRQRKPANREGYSYRRYRCDR